MQFLRSNGVFLHFLKPMQQKGEVALKERKYSVLVVSSGATFHAVLKSLLPPASYAPVCSVSSVHEAKDALKEQTFDFVIINTPLPDASGKRFAIDICGKKETVVLLFVKQELHEEIYEEVAEHGIFTLSKPTSKATISQALSWMVSAREHLRKIEKETISIEKKMEEIRIINRAKWLLISEKGMDEPKAHRYIEKQAMDRCLSKREIAEAILQNKTF